MGLRTLLRRPRRRRLLAGPGIPDDTWHATLARRPPLARLDTAEAGRLRDLATLFLAEKVFDPVGGADAGLPLRAAVAAMACLPLLNLAAGQSNPPWEALDWYDDWSTIIVTPGAYLAIRQDSDGAGVVHESQDRLAGEVCELGPVVLSARDIALSGRGDGYNVVVHEMAHKLDARDGIYDGCPPLPSGLELAAWRAAFSAAFADLRFRLAPGAGRPRRAAVRRAPPLDSGAAASPDEFFAAACEVFFDRPRGLLAAWPAVYAQLAGFFRQDPALAR